MPEKIAHATQQKNAPAGVIFPVTAAPHPSVRHRHLEHQMTAGAVLSVTAVPHPSVRHRHLEHPMTATPHGDSRELCFVRGELELKKLWQ